MVYSSSKVWALHTYDDPLFFVKRQFLFISLGLAAMVVMMMVPYSILKSHATMILIFCFILLLLVLIPGIGLVRGGARSWIGVGAFSIQPSEFMKLGMIIFLASLLATKQKYITSLTKGFLPL